MITSGKQTEEIISMITIFRSQVQAFAAAELLNINKYSENLVKRVLNIVYGWELDNLNKITPKFPGIDLGDTAEGIAFQITSTKKSDKVDDTLAMCIRKKHYETFQNINVFVLTKKQGTYTLKTDTSPYFVFNPDDNVWDFDRVLDQLLHLPPETIQVLHDFLKREMQATLDAIRNNKPLEEEKKLINVPALLTKTGVRSFDHWSCKATLNDQKISLPEMYQKLQQFLSPATKITLFLPPFNVAHRKETTLTYMNFDTGLRNHVAYDNFYNYTLRIEPSRLTVEYANLNNQEMQLMNLRPQMLMMLTQILFLAKSAKKPFEIELSVSLEANVPAHFHPTDSLVLFHVSNSYILQSPFKLELLLSDVKTETILDLFQKIIHGFMAQEPSFFTQDPFLAIDSQSTAVAINTIKKEFGFTE